MMFAPQGFVGEHRLDLLDEHASTVWLGKLDARAKLVGVLVFVTVAALLTRVELVFVSLAISVTFAVGSRLPARHLLSAYLMAFPFILIASASVFLFAGKLAGVAMLARTSACLIALLVLASGTETFDLFSGLRRLRMPATLTTLLMLTYKYILLLASELSRMTVARKARGFGGGKSLLDRYGLRVLSCTAGMVFVRSSRRAENIYEGLMSRGFSRDMTAWRSSKISAMDVVFVAMFFWVSGALAFAQLGGVP